MGHSVVACVREFDAELDSQMSRTPETVEATERTSCSNRGAGAVSSNSAKSSRSCLHALNMMIGDAQSAAQSSAAAFLVHNVIEIPTNTKAEVMASLR